MHPRNRHQARYDFATLIRASPELERHVGPNPRGDRTIDFGDPAAVDALNRALLKTFYDVSHWVMPEGYLCPPIPGRADYVHHAADLLAASHGGVIPRGDAIAILDIGIGANCIYPIIGVREYGWRFIGTDIDPVALASAEAIVMANPGLRGRIECRRQNSRHAIFQGIVRPGETFELCLCNPPFHASAEAAAAGTRRKIRNLGGNKASRPILNFGGRSHELWCRGGESRFVRRMIEESAELPRACRWFTALISKGENLPAIHRALQAANVAEVRILPMAQGQKQSRIVAWTFLPRPGQPGPLKTPSA